MSIEKKSPRLFDSINDVVIQSRATAFRSSNTILLNMYLQIGRLIVEDDQEGKQKSEYGKAVLKKLSSQLSFEFGKGFDESNLRNIRQFYLSFPIEAVLKIPLIYSGGGE